MNIDGIYRFARSLQARSRIRLPGFLRAAGYGALRHTDWTVNMTLGGVAMRIPAYLHRVSWETYEPASMEKYVHWCAASAGRPSVVLDIGSSIGIYACAALFADSKVEVVCFDSDIISLRIIPELTQHAPRSLERLRYVLGYLDSRTNAETNLDHAVAISTAAIAASEGTARYEEISYRCLTAPLVANTAVYTLDSLLDSGRALAGKRVLLKCDVEGAEVRVLLGAEQVLQAVRPDLLLSVHGAADLANHGNSLAELEALLSRQRYRVAEIARDHETHWWCTPVA